MNEIIKPGSGILFMKVGTHAQEGLEEIIGRKTEEIERNGFAMWGYGGGTCHPRTMVQPFAAQFGPAGPIHLVMQPMESNHHADPIRADEYSEDGINWRPVPESVHVLGSRYALVIKDLKQSNFQLPLDQTRVPVGPSMGRLGSRYIQGRVDKACLEVLVRPEAINEGEPKIVPIGLVAELHAPYAVFLRNTPR